MAVCLSVVLVSKWHCLSVSLGDFLLLFRCFSLETSYAARGSVLPWEFCRRHYAYWHFGIMECVALWVYNLYQFPFIDSSHDHLYTVLLFIDDSKNILFVSRALWYVLHPTIDCLWLGFIPSFKSCSWLFACYWIHCLSLDIQAIYPYDGPPTLVQTRACGPLKRQTNIWLPDCIHSRAWTALLRKYRGVGGRCHSPYAGIHC